MTKHTQMRMIPKCPGLSGDTEIVQKRIFGDDWTLIDERTTARNFSIEGDVVGEGLTRQPNWSLSERTRANAACQVSRKTGMNMGTHNGGTSKHGIVGEFINNV